MATRKENSAAPKTAQAETRQNKGQRETEKTASQRSSKTNKPKIVSVTFHVTVPEQTARLKRTVFLAGNLSQADQKMVDWDTQAQKMKKLDNNHWTVTIKAPENTVIEYKYTLGDWDSVERDQHCHDIGNRRVAIHSGETQTIEDTVHNWRNAEPCGS